MKNKKLAILVATAMVATVAGFVFTLGAGAAPGQIRLHLGSDGHFFQYGTTTQNLTTQSNSCKINSSTPIMAMSATPSASSPGLVLPDAIGVKSGSSNGTPCGQVDSTESLTFRAGSTLSGRTFTGARFDLEMTGNAVVKVTFANATQSQVFQLQTGTSIQTAQTQEADYDTTVPYTVSSTPTDNVDACAAPNSSGPNSGPNDNCEWTIQAGINASSITVTTVSAGSVAVEASNDFGNDPNFDTLFYLSNSPPVANTDTYSTPEDTTLNGNVLTNDTDADGNPLTASKGTTGPSHGTATVNADGTFSYTPALNYNGSDSFTYLASDGIASTQGTVNITVTPVNDPPVAQGGSVSTNEDTPITITAATDVDSTVIHTTCTGAQGGTVVDNGDGTITFTPPLNFNGSITLVCNATDDQGATTTSSATILVGVTPVNDAPVAQDDSAAVPQNTSTAINVLGNDTDVDSPTLTPVNIANVSPIGSTATAQADGTVLFTPPPGYAGAASFTYQASDGLLTSNTATVSITVYPVICSNQTVSSQDGGVEGSFTRLTDSFDCKQYALSSSSSDGTVLFQPSGAAQVDYRGFVSFGSVVPPVPGQPVAINLSYDPAGGNNFKPVLWCVGPTFDAAGNVLTASIPTGETWCIAEARLRPNSLGNIVTVWQVFGHDDPRFH